MPVWTAHTLSERERERELRYTGPQRFMQPVLIRMQNFKFTSLRLRCIFGGSCKNRCHLQQLVDKVCCTNYSRSAEESELVKSSGS